MKWIENRKIQSKTVVILLESLRMTVSMCAWVCECVCACVGYSCVLLYVCVYVAYSV